MPAPKHYPPPRQMAKLKELSNEPMPDITVHREAIRKKVQARRHLEDQRLARSMAVETGDLK